MLLHTPILSFPHIGLVPTGSIFCIFFCQTWIHIGLFGFRFVCKVIKIQQLSGILDIWYKTTPWWLWRALRRFIFYLVWYKLHVLAVVQSEEITSSTFTYKWMKCTFLNGIFDKKNWLMSQVKVIIFYDMIIIDLWSVFASRRIEYLVFTLLNREEKSYGYSGFQVNIGHDFSLHYATL